MDPTAATSICFVNVDSRCFSSIAGKVEGTSRSVCSLLHSASDWDSCPPSFRPIDEPIEVDKPPNLSLGLGLFLA
ncbi:hypothetical protein MPTK1_5g06420 [Marchantia polymorpha subsp. ruderalis]|uniref:Uncharacterized protein n=2 Tax=Marchantia polymorpha TaxID=3197 RepID=A0AAF6BFK1_MARPO|nr:hypothetical protein MARPO_0189s0012 [Marchantia polymorpha]BBN10785.1 hypothetical protein Mp_5g06420 [Marchantia polymorpha subsp. ruderalis]|eukprot:PTQ27639.1 hypothetical protein MARPO_0189s0012 [Marchantia polymorpha]